MLPMWLAVVALSGCALFEPPPAPVPSDYDASCSVAEDCAVVQWYAGFCGSDCPSWEALAANAAQQFADDQATYEDQHPCHEWCDLGCSGLPPEEEVSVTCDAGTCAAAYEESTSSS